MKKFLFISALLILAITSKAQKPRYIWIDACSNFVEFANSKENITRDLRKAYNAGFTDIVVDVRPETGDVLFNTSVVDQATQLPTWDGGYYHYHTRTATWDYLQAFIDAGHALGLKVHASINTFTGGCAHPYGIGSQGLVFRDSSKRDWVTTLYHNNSLVNALDDTSDTHATKFLNPANDNVQDFLLNIIRDLAKYNVDGIFLDRCRYEDASSDFSDISKTKFEKYLGYSISNFPACISSTYQKQWWAFRASVIHDFIVKARNTVKSVNSNIQFGTYVGAWYSIYNEVGVNWASPNYKAENNYSWASSEWSKYGYADHLDFMLLGAYASADQVYGSDEWSHQGFCKQAKTKLCGDVKFAGGADVGNPSGFENGGQAAVVTKTIDACMNASDGYFLFDMVHVRNFDYWNACKQGFKNIGISVPSDQPYIQTSAPTVYLSCMEGETATAEVSVFGNLINQWTTVEVICPEKDLFSVSPTGLNVNGSTHDFDPENPVLTIKFTPKKVGYWGGDIDSDGFVDYYITLHSVDTNGNDIYQWITLYGTGTSKPYINASEYRLDFECNVGETATANVTLDGYLINRWTTVEVISPEKGLFSVSPTGLNVSGSTHNFDPENPVITVSFTPTNEGSWGGDIDEDGYVDYYITLHSIDINGNDVYQWIALYGATTNQSTTQIELPYDNSTKIEIDSNIINATGEVSDIKIYSITGHLEAESTGENIDLNDLAPGIYIIKVTNKNGDVHISKISHSK